MRTLKIAMIGLKGIPAKWGGIEKYVEEIGKRLAVRGHEVTVFGSKWYCDKDENYHLGIRIKKVPTIRFQATDALTNAFFSNVNLMFAQYDIVHFHGYASYYFVPFINRIGMKAIVTVHAMESNWNNPKYGAFAKRMIQTAFNCGIGNAHCVTAVSRHIQAKLDEKHHTQSTLLCSGLDQGESRHANLISEQFGLKGGDYLLFLGRIDPIKRIDWLVGLARDLPEGIRVVIAGGAQDVSTERYLESLKANSKGNPRIVFAGPVSGLLKEELFSNCLFFLAPSIDEGLPISLLEASSYGRCVIASDIPAHREVIEDGVTGFLFYGDDQKAFNAYVIDALQRSRHEISRIGFESMKKVHGIFNWDKTVEKAEALYNSLIDK